jgi:hypothetical protein
MLPKTNNYTDFEWILSWYLTTKPWKNKSVHLAPFARTDVFSALLSHRYVTGDTQRITVADLSQSAADTKQTEHTAEILQDRDILFLCVFQYVLTKFGNVSY